MDRVICLVWSGRGSLWYSDSSENGKKEEKIRHERKDVDHGHFSGIYRRSLDLAESAESEEIDRT